MKAEMKKYLLPQINNQRQSNVSLSVFIIQVKAFSLNEH